MFSAYAERILECYQKRPNITNTIERSHSISLSDTHRSFRVDNCAESHRPIIRPEDGRGSTLTPLSRESCASIQHCIARVAANAWALCLALISRLFHCVPTQAATNSPPPTPERIAQDRSSEVATHPSLFNLEIDPIPCAVESDQSRCYHLLGLHARGIWATQELQTQRVAIPTVFAHLSPSAKRVIAHRLFSTLPPSEEIPVNQSLERIDEWVEQHPFHPTLGTAIRDYYLHNDRPSTNTLSHIRS